MLAVFAWQYLDLPADSKYHQQDLYVPVFGLLRLVFYMGWLKVGLPDSMIVAFNFFRFLVS